MKYLKNINMSNKKTINDIPLSEPKNNTERALIGCIQQEAEKIKYGSISVDVKVHNGKLTHLSLTQSTKSINLHNIS